MEIVTPHDSEARFVHRPGKTAWVGYKDHQTETCDAGPKVIVHVAIQTAPEQDISMVEEIHHALAERDLLPAEHLVDAGYTTSAAIHQAATVYGSTLLGPVRLISPGRRAIPASTRTCALQASGSPQVFSDGRCCRGPAAPGQGGLFPRYR
ncbi:hypothetical protein [Streptomyces sp. x-80]|uniref:hypothetical protein n=1 Tax=Streptomyces sp. x-80 TaxID=2789282 RepID=UPI00397F0FB5